MPASVTLLTKGSSPVPYKDKGSGFETLVGVVVGLVKVKWNGFVKLAGLLFPNGAHIVVQIGSTPSKKFGVTTLVTQLIDWLIIAPVLAFVVVASPVVPPAPFGVTLVAPKRMALLLPKSKLFGPWLYHSRK